MTKPPAKQTKANRVSIKGTPNKGHRIVLSDEDALTDLFGCDAPEMASGLMSHCLKVLKANEASDDFASNDERSFMLEAIKELAPRDAVERMLSVQMAATHVALVRSARWLANADTLVQTEAHYSGYNKLARTYTAQMEALRKHRNGGKQTVTVQHVNVEDGGQAIVGNVQRGK
ncbi:hypothetical protein [Sulfitobacter mediterraneus]|uniref:Uncharacterized protein n=1 Tax=Sulfitobacter mediterraneus TaxID=83219 RepID=A0A061SWE7_9RHOB|nr:hypothetical protein [Sulfitobacter mediterraneus]KAJ04129.1 hypothetical protein PM02_04710 [Sulfitobacter mediterraneus]